MTCRAVLEIAGISVIAVAPDGEHIAFTRGADEKDDSLWVIDINGARVMLEDGWGLVRASSNLPILVLRFEAKSQERLEEIKQLFRGYMDKYPEIGKVWHNE